MGLLKEEKYNKSTLSKLNGNAYQCSNKRRNNLWFFISNGEFMDCYGRKSSYDELTKMFDMNRLGQFINICTKKTLKEEVENIIYNSPKEEPIDEGRYNWVVQNCKNYFDRYSSYTTKEKITSYGRYKNMNFTYDEVEKLLDTACIRGDVKKVWITTSYHPTGEWVYYPA